MDKAIDGSTLCMPVDQAPRMTGAIPALEPKRVGFTQKGKYWLE
jgi:hypothetical protein